MQKWQIMQFLHIFANTIWNIFAFEIFLNLDAFVTISKIYVYNAHANTWKTISDTFSSGIHFHDY